MYDKLFDVNQGVKSVLSLVDINSAAGEKLLRQHADYLNALVKTGVEHAKALADVKDTKAAAELHKALVTDLNQQFLEAAKRNLQVAIETRDAIAKLLEDAVAELQPAKVKKAA